MGSNASDCDCLLPAALVVIWPCLRALHQCRSATAQLVTHTPCALQHPLVVELRRCMVPRLRKYLLHPRKVVRGFAAGTCMGLGCLSQDMVSTLGASQPTAIQVGAECQEAACMRSLRFLAACFDALDGCWQLWWVAQQAGPAGANRERRPLPARLQHACRCNCSTPSWLKVLYSLLCSSPQTRLIARRMDPEQGLVLQWQGLQVGRGWYVVGSPACVSAEPCRLLRNTGGVPSRTDQPSARRHAHSLHAPQGQNLKALHPPSCVLPAQLAARHSAGR